jgi:hypothetical protein
MDPITDIFRTMLIRVVVHRRLAEPCATRLWADDPLGFLGPQELGTPN